MNFLRAPCSTSGRSALLTRHNALAPTRVHARARFSAPPRSARADTVPVWETLVVVNGAAGSSQTPEEQKELLDTLWTLQYRTPGACCASAGPVLQSATRDGAGSLQAAVYYRFSAQAQAERFVAGSAFADAKARLLGSATVSLSLWKVLVPNDMEALFKRGAAFDTGVDVILSLEPAAGAEAPAVDLIVETVGRLQSAAMAVNSVQVSCGADLLSMTSKLMWMGRFPQEESAQRFLQSPAVVELSSALRSPGASPSTTSHGPLALTSVALIEIGAVEQSKERM
ncbi:hypothetical protein TSOC_003882 [Tetrabaena socialis]|uniref:ABM domain-containing protein n=1 Tax=Tetrabaena socialis TaxID=47790 RepID=A0A2J8AAF4_9CHLO|nr:hypothetical protein TSOC_003882 [Tetrabaena socialis]|eukprot:PNH09485.1 hypothetical protein TSOC_003882 [Tetrabaena socialis]